jgi:hypothetical protein
MLELYRVIVYIHWILIIHHPCTWFIAGFDQSYKLGQINSRIINLGWIAIGGRDKCKDPSL